MSLEGPNFGKSPPPVQGLRIFDNTQNRFIVKLVFKAKKMRKTAPKASKKRSKSMSKFIKNDFHEKRFLQHLPCDNHDLEVPNVGISI